MSKVSFTDEQVNAVLRMLEGQEFYDFYNGDFDKFITGDLQHDLNCSHEKVREAMKDRIKGMLS